MSHAGSAYLLHLKDMERCGVQSIEIEAMAGDKSFCSYLRL